MDELPLTRAIASALAKLMAIKDEYEVARLHIHADFDAQLHSQFERWDRVAYHLAPPLLAHRGSDGKPRKMRFGPWLRHGFTLLARLRFVRGTPLDVFGYTQERRIERALIDEFLAIVDELLATLDAPRLPLAVRIASVPETIRGYGHVKLANLATARAQWRDLLQRWRGAGVGSDAGAPRKIIPLHVE